ncbi:MAG: DEAD/DEAH box helicase [Candidatus Velthaea sp.]
MDSGDLAQAIDGDGEGFSALGLDPALIGALTALGYEEPTAIQREAIPPLLAGRDVLGQAATGTGKTAAFALPMLQLVAKNRADTPVVRGLILVPTRELAMQVAEAVHKYGRALGTRVLPIYGGQSIGQQLRVLSRGVDVVVATPGRALDHIRRETLDLKYIQMLVLDEADEMLDMGFADELDAILAAVPAERQTALFSATIAPRINAIAKRHLKNPELVTIAREMAAPGEALHDVCDFAHARVLDMESPTSTIVFCRTRTEVDELTETLNARGYRAEALHGGLSQEQRDRVMRRFRDGTDEVLVATDVAARGLDIDHVSHVVNFDVPSSPDAYVHRIGRTGRAGREGVAITLAEARENRLLRNIEHVTKRKIAMEIVPTVHDLRARRLELVRSSLEEALNGDGLEKYRGIVESLAADHDVLDVAAAAVKLADEADGSAKDEEDIPTVALIAPREPRTFAPSGPPRPRATGVTRIFVGAGRQAGIQARDLVGAIANEAGVGSRDIGAINISDRFSLVEVPEQEADKVVRALRATTIRGKKPLVRRDRDQ